MVMHPQLNGSQRFLNVGLHDILMRVKTCVLAFLIVLVTYSLGIADEERHRFSDRQETSTTQASRSSDGGLQVTVIETPRTFERVGQTIKLVYVIKNISGKSISNQVYVADSDARVVCAPRLKQVLQSGGTIQCKSTLRIDQQHFVDGEMRHNFLAVSGGNVSNIQESVICRKGWRSECDANTKIICDLHRDLKTKAVRPDICDPVISNTTAPNVKASKCRELAGLVFIDTDEDHRVDESEAGLAGVLLRSSNGAVAMTDITGKYIFPCRKGSLSGVEAHESIHIDEPTLPIEFKPAGRKSRMISVKSGDPPVVNFALHRKQIVTVDLLPSAFAPNQTDLLPTWNTKLGTIVQIVSRKESLLKITLRSASDPLSLSQARVSKVKSDLLTVLIRRGNQNLPEIEMLVIGRLTN
jgi:hypothetical protein